MSRQKERAAIFVAALAAVAAAWFVGRHYGSRTEASRFLRTKNALCEEVAGQLRETALAIERRPRTKERTSSVIRDRSTVNRAVEYCTARSHRAVDSKLTDEGRVFSELDQAHFEVARGNRNAAAGRYRKLAHLIEKVWQGARDEYGSSLSSSRTSSR